MWAKFDGMTEKTYLITDITLGPDNPVSVTVKAKLLAVEIDGQRVWIPVITMPDINERTATELAVRLDSWKD